MKEVRKAITTMLKTKADRVYAGENKVPKSKTYPYIVYEANTYKLDESTTILTLDVTAWDDKKNTSDLEDLMDELRSLDGYVASSGETVITISFETEDMSPQKEAENINRRLIVFTGHIH